MRNHVSWVRGVVLLVPLAALLLGAGSATVGYAAPASVSAPEVTATSTYSYYPLLDSRAVFPASGEVFAEVLTTPAFTMQKGEVRRVADQLDIRVPHGQDPEVNNRITCFDQGGQVIGVVSTGTNAPDNGHAYQWNVSMLITAPAQNTENYFCQIWTDASGHTGYQMSVLAPTPGQTTYGTWLEVSSGDQVGAQTASPTNDCDPTDSTGTCAYIGGPAGLDNTDAIDLFPVFASRTDVWTAADGATTIDAEAAGQITACYHGTSSCRSTEWGNGGVTNADGGSYLEIDQLYPNGSVCQVNQVYSEKSADGAVFLSENYDVTSGQHHLPLFYHASVPVSQLCRGSRQFAVNQYIWWTGGNPVKIDGGGATVNVLNSVTAATTAVPHVIGSPQAQADAAIAAAGLTVTAPDYVTAAAPVGTVLGQNSPAGTIEPVGSPVQITVSLGEATVPDVIGDLPLVADELISKAGLTPVTLAPVINCADPGTVQYQNPPGGTRVALNSQVDIQVGTCAG
jgi:PASTA domain